MSNHMAKSVSCNPATEDGDEDDRRRRDLVPGDAQDYLDHPEEEAGERHEDAERVKNTSGWKSRITYFWPIRHQKPLRRSQEMRGTTRRRRMPDRSPTS